MDYYGENKQLSTWTERKQIVVSELNFPPVPLLQLTGTNHMERMLEQVSAGIYHIISTALMSLLLAIWVTGFVGWIGAGMKRNSRKVEYFSDDYDSLYSDYSNPFTRRYGSPIVSKLWEVLDIDLSSIERLGSGFLETVSHVGYLIDDYTSSSNGWIGHDAETSNKKDEEDEDRKWKDCLLQAVCYITNRDTKVDNQDARKFKEGKKNTDKSKEETKGKKSKKIKRQKEKAQRKKEKEERKKLRQKNKISNDEEIDSLDSDIDSDESNYPKNDDEDEISEGSCDIFECNAVKSGYIAIQLFQKLNELKLKYEKI